MDKKTIKVNDDEETTGKIKNFKLISNTNKKTTGKIKKSQTLSNTKQKEAKNQPKAEIMIS